MNCIEQKDEFISLIRGKLNEDRFIHSLGVADTAVKLAEKFGGDKDKAYIAGLLHDVMKNESQEEQLKMMKKDDIILSQAEKNNPKLWHAMSGASFIKHELGITDPDIINAVRYHTTGRAGMSLLEKIIYTADFISPERNYPDVDVMRSLSFESLDKGDLYSLQFSLKKLSECKSVIHTDSVDFYNELVIKLLNEQNEQQD
ncbi:MAG: bis(5'-nucleosyl)-tetraphosphatase (symmetrical) YqeK [Acutalibacteraceae bacterium]